MLVARVEKRLILSPFFSKSEGVVVVDLTTNKRRFYSNPNRTAEATRDLILATGAKKLVCGYIGLGDHDALAAAGIDIRIGSCVQPMTVFISSFSTLPRP